jgi:hypothetical protein
MITKEQYESLKEFVLTNPRKNFFENLLFLEKNFGIKKPFRRELMEYLQQDGNPFQVSSDTYDSLSGEFTALVIFSH